MRSALRPRGCTESRRSRSQATDAELLERWRSGAVDAGQALIGRHQAALHRYFLRHAARDHQELLQRSIVACIEKRDAVREASSFRAFLFGIARFELLRYFVERRKQTEDLDTSRMPATDEPCSYSGVLADHEQLRLLAGALPRIPRELQLMVALHYWQGLSTMQMSRRLGIPQGTVKSRLRRARARLLDQVRAGARVPSAARSATPSFEAWAAGHDPVAVEART
ncbi:MAG: sigma-70 family RNA polymerase sigma factor [Myxococcota bacterium]